MGSTSKVKLIVLILFFICYTGRKAWGNSSTDSSYANVYFKAKQAMLEMDYKGAIDILSQKALNQSDFENDPNTLIGLAIAHLYMSDYQDAYECFLKCRRSQIYYNTASGIFQMYSEIAINHFSEIWTEGISDRYIKMYEEVKGKDSDLTIEAVKDVIVGYLYIQMYSEAIKYVDRYKSYKDYFIPLDYYNTLFDLGWAYNYTEKSYLAFLTFEECGKFYKEKFGEYSGKYYECLNGMAYESQFLWKEKMLGFLEQAEEYALKTFGELSIEYAVNQDNISVCYKDEDIQKALEYSLRSNDVFQKLDDKQGLARSYNNLGAIYYQLNNYEAALECFNKSLKNSQNSPASFNIGWLYYEKGEVKRGLENMEKAAEKYGQSGEDGSLAEIYADLNDYPNFINHEKKYFEHVKRGVWNNALNMTEYVRDDYWNDSRFTFDVLFRQAGVWNETDLNALCYDVILQSKSILLSQNQHFEDLIKNSNNPDIINKNYYLKILKTKLAKEENAETYLTKRGIMDSLEYGLLEEMKRKGYYKPYMNLDWRDIERNLSSKEVAIEFRRYKQANDVDAYCAMVIKKGETPRYFSLFTEEEYEKLLAEERTVDLYNNPKFGQFIWGRLKDYLSDVKSIYFSPDGLLYNLGIEYLPVGDSSCRMSEKCTMYRLTSTRELATKKEKSINSGDIVLYGGINYGITPGAIAEINDKRRKEQASSGSQWMKPDGSVPNRDSLRAFTDSFWPRCKIDSLPATKTEVEDIQKTLKSKGANPKVFLGGESTEESLKEYSGKPLILLHIATHGFYYNELEASMHRNFRFLLSEDNRKFGIMEDKSLTHSGLLMAGGANLFNNVTIPDSIDDGILTAQEISRLNFHNLDLVVLSACETGLGDITSEGVFGLQRGFKKAGAQSLLMSLWKVDDTATQLLMTQFYTYLATGKSKYESFYDAQKYLRTYKNGKYDSPQYWAAFIMLDATN